MKCTEYNRNANVNTTTEVCDEELYDKRSKETMESLKVKELRNLYGIHDSRNEYTEEQIIELSKREIYYIRPNGDNEAGDVYIEYKRVPGYISEDKTASIFIKDSTLTGDDNNYLPMNGIRYCIELKTGIYHDELNNIIYCTTDELQFCLDYEKKYVLHNIKEQIEEKEQELLKLKNTSVVFKQI